MSCGLTARENMRENTPSRTQELAAEKSGAVAHGADGGNMNEARKEIRMTIPRMADGLRLHMQMKEKFLAVMDEADLPAEAVDRLQTWLKEWHAGAVRREITRREQDVRALEREIEALRKERMPSGAADQS